MKNAAGILLVIYLFFLVPLLAGAFIDAAAGVKRRNISSTYANGFVAMLGIFWGVAVLFLYRGCTLEKLSMVCTVCSICGFTQTTENNIAIMDTTMAIFTVLCPFSDFLLCLKHPY